MSAGPKRGLGRGLGALLGESATSDVTGVGRQTQPDPGRAADAAPPRETRGFAEIAIDQIRANPQQPRRTFDETALDELRSSIAAFGVLVPVIVRARADGYELIAGERRWRAARAAGLTTIPAIVRNADDRESLEVAIIENLQRENLDPLEEAMGFAHLIETFEFTQEQVAARLGRARPSIANALRLLSLSDTIKQFVRDGILDATHARAILAFPAERREAMAKRTIAEGLTVRALEKLARGDAPSRRAPAPSPGSGSSMRGDEEWISRLRYRYGTQVRVSGGEGGGAIELRYADAADLLRIVDLLLGDSA